MKIFSEWWFWMIVLILILLATRKKRNKGGLLIGQSHEQGGIEAYNQSTKEIIFLEGGESIINKNTMQMKNKVICEGTPSGVASALNVLGGGIQFDANGKCIIVR